MQSGNQNHRFAHKWRIPVAIIVTSILVVMAPIGVALRESNQRAIEFEKERALQIARDVLFRSDTLIGQMFDGVARLKPYASSPCSDEALNVMRRIDLTSSYIQAVAHVREGKIVCSSLGREIAGLDLGPAEYLSPTGSRVRNNVRLDFAADTTFLVIETDDFAFIIHKDLPIDSSTYVDNVSLAVSVLAESGTSDYAWRHVTSSGVIDDAWLQRLDGPLREVSFVQDGRVVAMAKSSTYFITAIAVLPEKQVADRIKQLAFWLLPIGALSGLSIFLTLLLFMRSHMALLQREQLAREKAELALQVQQQQKMETIGRVAGGIAHDFNNFLTVIQGYLEMLQEETAVGSSLRQYSDRAVDAVDRSKNVIRTLLNFSRPALDERKVVRADALVKDIATLLRGVMPKNCSLSLEAQAAEIEVAVDQTQISQVIMNFVVNACDAYGAGSGNIVLRLRRGSAQNWPAEFSQWPSFTAGETIEFADMAHIEVEDRASGIAPEILSRLFEPFFSTKGEGKGTGLGLSIVYAVMQAHSGRLEVRSKLGEGTVFRFSLPLAGTS